MPVNTTPRRARSPDRENSRILDYEKKGTRERPLSLRYRALPHLNSARPNRSSCGSFGADAQGRWLRVRWWFSTKAVREVVEIEPLRIRHVVNREVLFRNEHSVLDGDTGERLQDALERLEKRDL